MNVLKKLPLRNINAFLDHPRLLQSSLVSSIRTIHKSSILNGLDDFYDDQKNWGQTEVKTGRSWKLEELRIKSNVDLHKLWYILLKERNMLLTMEEECKQKIRLFPSPERVDKVEDSMENIETVVKERNTAYHQLETGKSGLRETKTITGVFGLPVQHTEQEYLIPKEQNAEWLKEHTVDEFHPDIKKFKVLNREKEAKAKQKQETRDFNHVIGLLKRFPNMDLEAVREQYPSVNIEKAKRSRKCRGHFAPPKYNIEH